MGFSSRDTVDGNERDHIKCFGRKNPPIETPDYAIASGGDDENRTFSVSFGAVQRQDMRSMIASANSDVLTLVAPSMRRSKS